MYGVPRIAEGKYLKLLYSLHAANGTLNISDVSKLSSVRLGKQASREGETTCLLFGRYVEKLKRICDKARLRVLG